MCNSEWKELYNQKSSRSYPVLKVHLTLETLFNLYIVYFIDLLIAYEFANRKNTTADVMKPSNSPSPRFLYEFDTVDTLALRNISEKRKLQEQLTQLEKQLHSNLVRMESEILSIRLENCETSSPANLQRKKAKCKESKSNVKQGKTNSTRNECSHEEAKNNSRKVKANLCNFKDGVNFKQARQSLSSHDTLPKITTSSYLTVKQEQNNGRELSNKNGSLETISELGQKQQQAEQRILMSLQRPRTNLRVHAEEGTIARPPTPQASSQMLSPLKPLDMLRRASSYGHLDPLSDEYVTNERAVRAFSAPDLSEPLDTGEMGRLRSFAKRQNQVCGEIKGDGIVANGIKICVTDENGSPKPESRTKFKLDPIETRGGMNMESKGNNFDEVLRSRLELLENGGPRSEDLQNIRYLRMKDEREHTHEVQDIFAVSPQD